MHIYQFSGDEEEQMRTTTATFSKNEDCTYSGQWKNENGGAGKVTFSFKHPDVDPIVPTLCETWNEFKSWATEARHVHNAALFRGHGNNKFELCTTLHRAGRNRLERYCADELRIFRQHAEPVLNMKIDLEDAEEYGTLLGLAQHHGVPTPLLDWTSSPYIAAFFAFSDAIENAGSNRADATHVRIYALTRAFRDKVSPAIVTLTQFKPYACCLNISARHNPRLYAQQGQFLVTNMAKLEPFIRNLELEDDKQYLLAADVPVTVAAEAIEDLQFMGLSASTMFQD